MIFLQLAVYCAVLTLMVRISVIGGAINAVFFYPQKYQDEAVSRGIADKDVIAAKRKKFMIPFVTVMFVSLLLIVGVWIRPGSFLSAYLYSLLLLEVMNWYDGIVIDRVWVGHSKFWAIDGMDGVPYVQPWRAVLKKRGILTVIWPVLSLIPAGIITLFRIILQ